MQRILKYLRSAQPPRQLGGAVLLALALVAVRHFTGQPDWLSLRSAQAEGEPTAASPLADDAVSYRAYALRHLPAEAARQQLSQTLASTPRLEIVADSKQNRLVVRSNAPTHVLVAELLQKIDRPAVATEAPAAPLLPSPSGETSLAGTEQSASKEPRIEAYPLNDQTREMLSKWQQQTAGRPDVRVALDERTSQALVNAPPQVHAEIRQQLAQVAGPPQQHPLLAAPDGAAAAPGERPITALEPPAGTATIQLRNLPAAELHGRIERLLGHPLPASVDASGQWQGFTVEASPGVAVTMSVNAQTGQVRVDGPPQPVAAWRSVVEAIDSPPAADSVTQLVSTKPSSHDRVRKALKVLQTSGPADPTRANLVAMMQPPAGQPAPAQPAPAGQQPAPGTDLQTAQQAIDIAEAAGGLLGPVQIEFVEGLDVIVIRGAERDVQRVMDIIEQIEDLSEVTVPAITIHELQNIGSMQIAILLNQLYAPTGVLGSRIGTVSITPLGKPNALLLIGRSENVEMAIDLIRRLDQPVSPMGRFEVFTLRNASAVEAKAIIDGFISQGELQPAEEQTQADGQTTTQPRISPLDPRALVVADPRINALIVVASPRDMAEIAALIARIDTPGVGAALKVFTIRNGDAESLATMLRQLFGVTEEQADATAAPGLSQGGPVRVVFSVDLRTNSIVAAGSQDDLAVVEAILLRLDEGEMRERVNRVYRLKNAFANDVAVALQQLLTTERTAETEAELAISPFEQIEREVVIVPELASNSLVISATPRFYERVIALVEDLDERPPMVLIQVLIAEVRLNDTDQFGVEFGLQDSLLFDRSLLSDVQTLTTTTTNQVSGTAVTVEQQNIINSNGQPGFNFNNTGPLGNNLSTQALANASNVAAQGLSNFSVGRFDPTLGFGGFVFSASSDAVSVLLRALQESRRLEVLSRPQLMALDGQVGYVQVGQNVPTIIATAIDPLAGTINSIQYQAVGLILQVVPRISPDGLVVMQITAQKSEVGPEIEGIPISISPAGQILRAPRIEITQAQTTVSAISGQTVVLGGLIQTRKLDVHRRVPIIADIPLLGSLFRYDSVSEERRELLIIMTPRVIYSKSDSDLVKQIESSRMSWCLADVVNVHGEAGLRSRCDEWFDGETEAVYPTFIPDDQMLMQPYHGELLPTPMTTIGPPVLETLPPPVVVPGPVEEVPSLPVMPVPPPPTTLPDAPLPTPPQPDGSPLSRYETPAAPVPAVTQASYQEPQRFPEAARKQ